MAIRKNFYNGQTVVPKDLNQLYDYTTNCNAELVSQIFGYGIVEGLEVTVENLRKIIVSPGLAYTLKGVRLHSEVNESIIIPEENSAEDQTEGQVDSRTGETERRIPLGLRLDYTKTVLQKDYDNADVATTWTPKIKLVLGDEITPEDLSIAVLTVNANEVVNIEKNGHRFFNFKAQEERIHAFSTISNNLQTQAMVEAHDIVLTAEGGTSVNANEIVLTAEGGTSVNASEIVLTAEGGTSVNANEIVLTAVGETNINADTVNLNANININNRTLQDTIRDMIYPIGTFYTQYPNPTNGQFVTSKSPNSLFGGVWELRFSDKGMFFRTEGGRSGQGRGSNGVQNDTMQRLTGEVTANRFGWWNGDGLMSGCFYLHGRRWESSAYGGSNGAGFYFDNSRQARTDNENRSVNMLIKIWERIS